jgi:RNA polymerase sigma factor (sigma-70 family)
MRTDSDTVKFWLDAAGRYPVLSPNQILLLARRVQSSTPGSKEYNRAVQKIVKHNLKLIPRVAKTAMRKNHGKSFGGDYTEDALQCGVIGLTRAAQLYDPKKGYAFSTYANAWIFQSIKRDLYKNISSIRVPESTIREYYSCLKNSTSLDELRLKEPQKFHRYVDAAMAMSCRSLDSFLNPQTCEGFVPDSLGFMKDPGGLQPEKDVFEMVSLSTTCPKSKEMVIEHFCSELTIKEIAARYGFPRNKAAAMIRRCLESIKENMTLV